MTLNAGKSNAILFATSQWAQLLSTQISVNISGIAIPLSNHVKIIGVVLDPRITLSEHTKAVSKSSFYHICALKHIHNSLDFSMIRTIAAALSPLGWTMQTLSILSQLHWLWFTIVLNSKLPQKPINWLIYWYTPISGYRIASNNSNGKK